MSEALRELLARFDVSVDPEGNLAKGEARVDSLKAALAGLEARLSGLKSVAAPAARAVGDAFARAGGGFGATPGLGAALQDIGHSRLAGLFGQLGSGNSDRAPLGKMLGPTRETLTAFQNSWRGRFEAFRAAGSRAFADVGSAAKALGRSIDVGGGLQAIFSLRNALVGLGAIQAGRAIAGLVGEIGDLSERAQKLGVTTEEFQRLDVLAKQSNTSVEALGGAFRVLANVAVNPTKESAEAFQRLHVSIKQGDGTLKSRNDLFFESAEALADVKNDTERAGLAQKIFGRGAQELLPLIANGSAAVRSQRAELMKLAVISDAESKAADELSDSWKAAGASLEHQFMKVVVANLPLIRRIADAVFAFGQGVATFVSKVDPARVALAGLATSFLLLDTSILPVALSAAALALAFLTVEDFFTFLQGGDSEIGLLAEKLFGKGGAKQLREDILQIGETIKQMLSLLTGGGVNESGLQRAGIDTSNGATSGLLASAATKLAAISPLFSGLAGAASFATDSRAPGLLGDIGRGVPQLSGPGMQDNRTQQVTVNVGSTAEVQGATSGALQGLNPNNSLQQLGAAGG